MIQRCIRHASASTRKIFCDGSDQQFYVRNNLFAKKQNPKKPLISYGLDSFTSVANVLYSPLTQHSEDCWKEFSNASTVA